MMFCFVLFLTLRCGFVKHEGEYSLVVDNGIVIFLIYWCFCYQFRIYANGLDLLQGWSSFCFHCLVFNILTKKKKKKKKKKQSPGAFIGRCVEPLVMPFKGKDSRALWVLKMASKIECWVGRMFLTENWVFVGKGNRHEWKEDLLGVRQQHESIKLKSITEFVLLNHLLIPNHSFWFL